MKQPKGEPANPFERYSELAGLALYYSRAALSEHGGTSIEPSHLLLGLLNADAAIGRVLTPPPALQVLSECIVSAISSPGLLDDAAEVPLGPATKSILSGAEALAAKHGHPSITTQHLLLALLTHAEGAAIRCLRDAGVNTVHTMDALRARLR